jgi:hypothetical protein
VTIYRPMPMRPGRGGRPFDVVIANAGVMRTPFGRTVDGFETRLGTNLSAISCW